MEEFLWGTNVGAGTMHRTCKFVLSGLVTILQCSICVALLRASMARSPQRANMSEKMTTGHLVHACIANPFWQISASEISMPRSRLSPPQVGFHETILQRGPEISGAVHCCSIQWRGGVWLPVGGCLLGKPINVYSIIYQSPNRNKYLWFKSFQYHVNIVSQWAQPE